MFGGLQKFTQSVGRKLVSGSGVVKSLASGAGRVFRTLSNIAPSISTVANTVNDLTGGALTPLTAAVNLGLKGLPAAANFANKVAQGSDRVAQFGAKLQTFSPSLSGLT